MPENLTTEQKPRLIHIRLADETHRRLRIRVAEEDTSIQLWVENLIEGALSGTSSKLKGKGK